MITQFVTAVVDGDDGFTTVDDMRRSWEYWRDQMELPLMRVSARTLGVELRAAGLVPVKRRGVRGWRCAVSIEVPGWWR